MAIEEASIPKRHRKNGPIDITCALRHSQSLSTMTVLNQWDCRARNTPTTCSNCDKDKLQSVAAAMWVLLNKITDFKSFGLSNMD